MARLGMLTEECLLRIMLIAIAAAAAGPAAGPAGLAVGRPDSEADQAATA